MQEIESKLEQRGSIGVAMPGAVSISSNLLKNSNSQILNGRPFSRDLRDALNRPVKLYNDANCFVLSEAIDGSAKEASVVFGVIIGTGTGGGIAIDKKVLTGINAISGEWGHNPLPWPESNELPGPSCYCGKNGCIETFLSGPGLSNDYRLATGKAKTPPEIVAIAETGGVLANECLNRYIDRLSRGLASVINILDPDVVVLGGGLSNIRRLYAEVPRNWRRYIFSDHVSTALKPALHGDSSGVRGAAWLWTIKQLQLTRIEMPFLLERII